MSLRTLRKVQNTVWTQNVETNATESCEVRARCFGDQGRVREELEAKEERLAEELQAKDLEVERAQYPVTRGV